MKSLLFRIIFIIPLSLFLSHCNNPKDSDNQEDNLDTIVKIDSSQVEQKIDLSKYDRSFNDMALWLAGIPQDENGTYKELEANEEWQNYSSDMTEAFNTFRSERVVKLDSFRENELTEVNNNIKTLFYPYSRPDFINANIFFSKSG